MIEAEEAFVTNLEIVLQRIENCIKELTSSLVSKHSNEIEYMLKHNETDSAQHLKMLENVIMQPFTVMTFSEAKSLIQNNKDKIIKANPKDTFNFTKEEELFIVDKNNNTPVFVIDWPKNAKPFYMKECIDDPHLVSVQKCKPKFEKRVTIFGKNVFLCLKVKGVDLLVPNVGELCGGGLREDNYDILENKLKDLNILDNIKWYLEIRKFGNVPTAGFGIGFERFLQFLLNVQNIKDTIPFPRWPHGLQL